MTLSWELADKDKLITALQAAPTEFAKQSEQAASRNAGTVNKKAEANFNASILRPQESGHRPEWRETGHFTFGSRYSGTFAGQTLIDKNGRVGFGYPNIPQADASTNYVWRSLEYGLGGTVHSPTSLLGVTELFPTGQHVLPSRYTFGNSRDTDGGNSSGRGQVMLVGKQYPKRNRQGGGIEGKHFIENAWIESLYIISKRYKDATDRTMRVAFGRGR